MCDSTTFWTWFTVGGSHDGSWQINGLWQIVLAIVVLVILVGLAVGIAKGRVEL